MLLAPNGIPVFSPNGTVGVVTALQSTRHKAHRCCSGLFSSGQISMRKLNGWQRLATHPTISQLTSLLNQIPSRCWKFSGANSNHITGGTCHRFE
jgi:hypothetical protein